MLHTILNTQWEGHFPDSMHQQALKSLENGRVLFFPTLNFTLTKDEKGFLNPEFCDPNSKNIGYNAELKKLWGVRNVTDEEHLKLKSLLDRFERASFQLVKNLLPRYSSQLIVGRTSYRPVQVSNRKTSVNKDDRRLHVDAFPSAPNQGQRILRVFCNINPHSEDRVWRIGEPFEQVAERFLPRLKGPIPGSATLLRALKITKSYRTPYDHYMLRLHNAMKADDDYQKNAIQQEMRFPAGSSWIVQTDHVSHAAMSGQYVLEQTFYLPVKAMQDENLSPLRTLERLLNQKLV